MRSFVSAILVLSLALLLGGCETGQGLGKDMEKAGEWIQKKAEQATKKR